MVDTNVQTHGAIRELGASVHYGDAGNPETLRHAHVETAQLVICTIPDELLRGTSNEAIVRAIRGISKDVMIFACASKSVNIEKLMSAGANYVYVPAVETASGVLLATAAALQGQLEDFRAQHVKLTGSLNGVADVYGMSV